MTYEDCWFSRTPMHENGHNQGAVQSGPPGSDGAGHCTEHEDVMCYPSVEMQCPGHMLFDCGFDSYFDAAPEPGEWLDSHWNLASPLNRYVVLGGDAGEPPGPPAVHLRGPRSPRRGARIDLVAGVAECSWEAEIVRLERKSGGSFTAAGEKILDDACEARFSVRAGFRTATFRSSWTSAAGEVVVSKPLTIRTRR